MVDSINSSGAATNVLSVGKSQKFEDQSKSSAPKLDSVVDEVKISAEALSLTEAQTAANEAYKTLEARPDVTLSSNTERLNTLV